ncbi:MAG: hypothetical protein IPO37_10660 [Saprospiraceae bacterium]|nr:hypothetical protein [Saprospiraceae bacterium]
MMGGGFGGCTINLIAKKAAIHLFLKFQKHIKISLVETAPSIPFNFLMVQARIYIHEYKFAGLLTQTAQYPNGRMGAGITTSGHKTLARPK